jgi:CelD/BcsL family acetyltransferase involved in cellulose biosynthesis
MDLHVHSEVTTNLWAQYEAIFADSWKGDEGAPEFLRALAAHQSKKGSLRLGFASYEGRPIAAQLWTVDHGHAIIHKLAYRDDSGQMSPGTLLSAAMFRHAIDTDKVKSISYGTGDDGYKRDWMDQRDQLYILEFFNPLSVTGLLGLAKSAASRAWNALKPRKKT